LKCLGSNQTKINTQPKNFEMNLSLENKRAVVCGSTQGIGKAIAVELALLGASITLIARNESALVEVVAELNSNSDQQHDFLVADFSNPKDLKAKIDGYLTTGQTIDILVNNTGGPAGGPIIDADYEQFTNTMTAHLQCNHILAQALVPGMKAKGFGRIINIISTSVKQPIPGLGVSNTVRGAVASWSKTLSLELGEFGITVNNVLPGFTNTARLDYIINNKAEKSGKSKSEIVAAMTPQTPAKRFGEPEEIAAMAAFLATPSAAYVNGVSIPVDGGRTGSL